MNTFDYTKLQSVMADRSSDKTSNKYSFIPTYAVIRLLEKNGWFVNSAREAGSKKHHGYQQHEVRFRQQKDINRKLLVDEIVTEAILKTAHDGTTQWEFSGGFRRCWCDNQCTVSAGTVEEHKVKHVGYTDMKVLDAVFSIADDMPKIMDKMETFKSIHLNSVQKYIYASKALDLVFNADKWEKYNKPATIKHLLKPRRPQDECSNLWNTYNIVQEKLIKGGSFLLTQHSANYYNAYPNAIVRGNWSRGIKSLSKDSRVNKELWSLAEETESLQSVY